VVRQQFDVWAVPSILLFNEFCEIPVSEDTVSRIYRAFGVT
jgi:hypothetical protein